jgi:hypothetical protein
MHSQKTENVYRTVMERLFTEVKNDFIDEGCHEETLKEFKSVSIYINNLLKLLNIDMGK